jgi:hypothetical protein
MRKWRCHDHEIWTWSDESSFTLFPASGRVYIWRTPKEACNPECLVEARGLIEVYPGIYLMGLRWNTKWPIKVLGSAAEIRAWTHRTQVGTVNIWVNLYLNFTGFQSRHLKKFTKSETYFINANVE